VNAEKGTAPKPFCFVLMPFRESFDDVYALGIRPACEAAGAYCERVDEQIFPERILDRIYNQIAKADVIVADLTGRSPNVFYEVGYAHALGKTTVLLTRTAEDIPFDLQHFSHIVYGDKITTLRNELEKRIAHFTRPSAAGPAESIFGVDVYLNDQRLVSSPTVLELHEGEFPQFVLVVHNVSSKTYPANQLRVGIRSRIFESSTSSRKFLKLPDGAFLFQLPEFVDLLPDAVVSYGTTFYANVELKSGTEWPFVVKAYAPEGSREFPVVLRVTEPRRSKGSNADNAVP
jgi:hypothetical protein